MRALSRGHYTSQQIESAIRYVFGPDTTLISDGTYYVLETDDGMLAGCGGWSRRRALFGGDQMKNQAAPVADSGFLAPGEAARVRAFFVAPAHVRQGVGTRLLAACVEAARAAGFSRLELAATLPGELFYRCCGFTSDERFETNLPDGTGIAFVRMSYNLGASLPA